MRRVSSDHLRPRLRKTNDQSPGREARGLSSRRCVRTARDHSSPLAALWAALARVAGFTRSRANRAGGWLRRPAQRQTVSSCRPRQASRSRSGSSRARIDGRCRCCRTRRSLVDFYLRERCSVELCDSCVLPSLSIDVARARPGTIAVYQTGLSEVVDALSAGFRGDRPRDRALALISILVGAALMARALPKGALRDELLESACTAAKGL